MWHDFAEGMRNAVKYAIEEAEQLGHPAVDAPHLILGALRENRCAAVLLLKDAGLSPEQVRAELEALLAERGTSKPDRISDRARRLLQGSLEEARRRQNGYVGTEHLLCAAVQDEGELGQRLRGLGLSIERLLELWQTAVRRMNAEARRPVTRVQATLRSCWGKARRSIAGAYHVLFNCSLGNSRFATDPYPLYRKLREKSPVRLEPMRRGMWVITRYDDVLSVIKDPRFVRDDFSFSGFPEWLRPDLAWLDEQFVGRAMPYQMLFLDPPHHTRIRSAFMKAFAAYPLQTLRPKIQQITDTILDRTAERGSMDLISELAYPLPTKVIAELLGFPPEDYELHKKWSDDFAALLSPNVSEPVRSQGRRSLYEMRDYFHSHVARTRNDPGDNLIARLLPLTEQEESRLAPHELFSNVVLLLAAGHETTSNFIGNAVFALLRNPEQLDLLRQDESIMPTAIEELLRYDSPVQWTGRMTREPVTLRGVTIPAGHFVLASLGSANRDPAQFSDPDRLDLRRAENKHLAFGHGIHYCLGAMLARLEGDVAIGTLVRRFPNMRTAKWKPQWGSNMIFRGLRSLPLSLR